MTFLHLIFAYFNSCLHKRFYFKIRLKNLEFSILSKPFGFDQIIYPLPWDKEKNYAFISIICEGSFKNWKDYLKFQMEHEEASNLHILKEKLRDIFYSEKLVEDFCHTFDIALLSTWGTAVLDKRFEELDRRIEELKEGQLSISPYGIL